MQGRNILFNHGESPGAFRKEIVCAVIVDLADFTDKHSSRAGLTPEFM